MKPGWLVVGLCSVCSCGKDAELTMMGPDASLPEPDAPPGVPVSDVSGHLTTPTTWTGIVHITGPLAIDAGVVVTVMPGTAITVAQTATISLAGTLDIEGTSANRVTIAPAGGAPHWAGLTVASTGVLIAHYAVETGGWIDTLGTAHVTIIDSTLSHASHDLLVMSGGTIDVEYSSLGVEPGETDTTHCELHANNSGNVLKIVHSNLSSASYGIMFYGGNAADFTYDNWFGNAIDVDVMVGVPVSGNFSHGWFEQTAPSGTGIATQPLAASRVTDAGPRP